MRSHKEKYSSNSIQFGKNGFTTTKARNISLGTQLAIFFQGVLMIIGLAFLLMGSLFLGIFGMLIDFDDWRFSDSDPLSSEVVVLSESGTGASENDTPVYEYSYEFKTPDGKLYTGTSYHTGGFDYQNQKVKVQYLKDNPEISRIENTRKGQFPPFIIIFLLIFPLVGGIMTVISTIKNLKYIKLVKYGTLTSGTFSHNEHTGGSVNKVPVMRYYFNFKDDTGKDFVATGETHIGHRLTDEEQELLVYNPEFPHENVMIDALPLSVKKYFWNENSKVNS
jgi:hypothetical protein